MPKKGCFRSKIDKINSAIEFCILELVKVPNFSLNWQFWFFFFFLIFFFDQKKKFRSKTEKLHLHVRPDATVFSYLFSFYSQRQWGYLALHQQPQWQFLPYLWKAITFLFDIFQFSSELRQIRTLYAKFHSTIIRSQI